MLTIKNDDYYTRFAKHILTNGKCQVVITQTDSSQWLFDKVFNTETQADEFLNNYWGYFCKISKKIHYIGFCAMSRACQDFKDGYFD